MAFCKLDRIYIAALGVAVSFAVAAPAKEKTSATPCKPGMDLYAAGDVLKAIKSLEKCLEGGGVSEAGRRQAWTALGNASLEAGRFGGAADAYAHAEKIKPGNAEFLESYLQALEGAGRHAERIPVFRALLSLKPGDRKLAESYLAAVEMEGVAKYQDDFRNVLESLAANPESDPVFSEKLAALYLNRGLNEKAEAEYRGLLARRPEAPEYWVGLASSEMKSNPDAAAECYRKAALFSEQAAQRQAYQSQADRLSGKQGNTKDTPVGLAAAPAQGKPAKASASSGAPAAAPAAITPAAVPATAAAPVEDNKAKEKSAMEAEKKAKEEKDRREKLAREDKQRQDKARADSAAKAEEDMKAAAVAEKKAREDKERLAREESKRQDKARADSVAKADAAAKVIAEAEKKSREDKERVAREEAKRQDKVRADSVAKADAAAKATAEAEKKAKEDKNRQEKLAREDKQRQDKARADSAAKAEEDKKVAAAAEKKAREDKERLAREEAKRLEKIHADSVAKAEATARALAEAEKKARADSVAKAEAAGKALAEIEKKKREEQERLALEAAKKHRADSLAKAEEDRRARAEAEKKAREEVERLARLEKERKDKARADSLARVEEERRAKAEAERKAKEEREARERQERRDRAIAWSKAGKSDSAAALFKQVLAESPDSEACYYAGRASLDQKDWDRSLDLFVKSSPSHPDLDGLKGKALMGMGRDKEALIALERQYQKTKEEGLLESLVTLKKNQGDEPGAIAYLEKLAEARPREIKFQEELASYYSKKGDKPKALERYAKVLSLDPSHGEANYRLGMDWSSQGVHDRAAPLLEKSVVAFPNRGDAWKALGKGDAALGRRDEAWRAYSKAQSLLPQDVDIAKGRVALAKNSSKDSELDEAYRGLLRLVPGDADAAMGLAKLRFKAEDFPEAEKLFRIACPGSKDGAAWAQYGRALRETKKPNESVAALLKAVELGEGGIPLKLELASSLFETGNVDKADTMARDMAKHVPSDPEPWYLQGRIAMARQQVAVAEEHFRKADRLRPDQARYAEAFGRLLLDRDDYRAALTVFSQAEANLSTQGKLMLAYCHGVAGDRGKALDIYAKLEKKEPSPHLLSRKIDLLVRMGQADRAVETAAGSSFAEADEVRYSLAKAQISLSQSHVLRGDLDAAVSLLKKVLSADDHNAEYHLNLGIAYYLQEKYKKAMGEFSDALGYRQDYPEALFRKGLCMVKLDRASEADDFFVELSQHADSAWKARGLYGRALVFEKQEKWEAVEHHLVLSLATQPQADALAFMSRVSLRQGKVAEAEEWAKRALELDHAHEEATLALAEALSSRKKYPEAMGLAQQALKMKPLSCGLLVQTAKLSYQSGRLDSTLVNSDQAIRACPQEPGGYFYAGLATHGSKPEEAKRYFKSYRKLGGDTKLIPE